MFKKLLTVLLATSIMCSTFSANIFAQEELNADAEVGTEIKLTQAEQTAKDVMVALNIMTLGEEGQLETASNVTRGEYTSYLIKMLNMNIDYFTTPTFLEDVDQNTQYAQEIYAAYKLNILTLSSDKKFHPDEIITREQAIKMMIVALGYTPQAEDGGGYPIGYLNMAMSLKLTIPQNEQLVLQDVANLIYSALDVDIQTFISSNQIEGGKYNINGKTLLEKNFNMEKFKKTVIQANTQTNIVGGAPAPKNSVIINDKIYYSGTTPAEDYVGMKVMAIVTNNEDDSNSVVYVTPYRYVETFVTYDKVEANSEFLNYEQFVYNEDDKIIKLPVNKEVNIIKNGEYIPFPKLSDYYPKYGYVKLIDSDKDGEVDVMYVTDAEICVAKSVDLTTKKVADVFGHEKIDLSKPNAKFYYEGVETTINAIKTNNVLWICRDSNKEALNVLIFDNEVSGKILELRDSGAKLEALISEKWYTISPDYLKLVPHLYAKKLEMGSEYTFAVDGNNTICASISEKVENVKKYGWMTKADVGGGINTSVSIESFEANGKFKIYKLPKKLKYNGNMTQSTDFLKAVKVGGVFMPQAIMYEIDENEVIKSIHTVTADGELKYTPIVNEYFSKGGSSFAGKATLDDVKTIVMLVPENGQHEKHFVVSPEYFEEISQTVDLYNVDKYSRVAAMVVVKTSASGTGQQKANESINETVISKVTKIIKDNEEVYVIYGLKAGNETTVHFSPDGYEYLEPEIAKLKCGDVVQLDVNGGGFVTNVRKLFDVSKPGVADLVAPNDDAKIMPKGLGESGGDIRALNRRALVKVKYANQPYIVSSFKPDGSDDRVHSLQSKYAPPVVYEYDHMSKKVSVGKFSEIQDNDYLFIKTRYNVPITIMIIKNMEIE